MLVSGGFGVGWRGSVVLFPRVHFTPLNMDTRAKARARARLAKTGPHTDTAVVARLPREVVWQIAHWLDCRQLLPLRLVARAWLGLVSGAVQSHPACEEVAHNSHVPGVTLDPCKACTTGKWAHDFGGRCNPRVPAESIAAWGRVFGRGCRRFRCTGRSPRYLTAMRRFVCGTGGRLVLLDLSFAFVTSRQLLQMCRWTPQLTYLDATGTKVETQRESTGADDPGAPVWLPLRDDNTAAAVGRLCPLLEFVDLPAPEGRALTSPAETWARHFPQLKQLRLGVVARHDMHVPSVLATLAACPRVAQLNFDCCRLSGLQLLSVAQPHAARLTTLDLRDTHPDDPAAVCEALLRLLPQCRSLRALHLPAYFCRRAHCEALAAACPRLTRLDVGGGEVTDEGLAALCSRLPLERLQISNIDVSDRGLDALWMGPCAATLTHLNIAYLPFVTGSGVLRLVTRCRNLRVLEWNIVDEQQSYMRLEPAILDFMAAQGGRAHIMTEDDELPFDYQPWLWWDGNVNWFDV